MNTRTIVLASAVAGGIIVIAGIALFFTRRMWLPKPKRAEGEEEDGEDDDGDAAEIEETDEGDDEDDEDGDEKPRKKKKRGLFGRKKR